MKKTPRAAQRGNDRGAGLSRAAQRGGKDKNRGEQGGNHPCTSCSEIRIAREGPRFLIAAGRWAVQKNPHRGQMLSIPKFPIARSKDLSHRPIAALRCSAQGTRLQTDARKGARPLHRQPGIQERQSAIPNRTKQEHLLHTHPAPGARRRLSRRRIRRRRPCRHHPVGRFSRGIRVTHFSQPSKLGRPERAVSRAGR